jgi:pimeloyl-ACP methyl ester carboxylesterase
MMTRRFRKKSRNAIERGGLGTGMMSALSSNLGETPSAIEEGAVAGSDLQTELGRLDVQTVVAGRQEQAEPGWARTIRRSMGPQVSRILVAATAATAGAALCNVYLARRLESRYPPRGRSLSVDGVRLHYIEAGEGSPVLLIHGNFVTADDFVLSGVFDRLASRYRVIAVDRPGYGYSGRPWGRSWTPGAQAALVRQALQCLGIERAVVLGHSFGALVALALALDHPDAVRGLALLSGYYYPTGRADVPLFAQPAIPVIGDLMRYTVSPLIGRALMPIIVKGMFAPRPVPKRFSMGFPYGMSVRPWQIRAEAQDAALLIPAAKAICARYGAIMMPLAVMAGVNDRAIDVDQHAKRLHRDIPHSTLRLLPDAGHMVHHAAPDQVLQAVAEVAAA